MTRKKFLILRTAIGYRAFLTVGKYPIIRCRLDRNGYKLPTPVIEKPAMTGIRRLHPPSDSKHATCNRQISRQISR